MKKILIVFGTRPEAIKLAPIILKLRNFSQDFIVKICLTGQHREMLDQVLDLFKIKFDYDLKIMKSSQNLCQITSNILLKLNPILVKFDPDIVMVHGDTATSFAASLAAYYNKIKIAHVEAGLRTNNLYSPWPEEGNRKLTTILAEYHFAPTDLSKENLLKEGVDNSKIYVVGNTVIDTLNLVLKKIDRSTKLRNKIRNKFFQTGFKNLDSTYVLITGHRRENFGEGFLEICKALEKLAKNNPDVTFVYPVHLNPNVKNPVMKALSCINNIILLYPLEYEEFVYLMSKSKLILTDSGGIQEEAPTLGKPVLLMRNTTERPEAINSGTVKLLGHNKDKIIYEVEKLLNDDNEYEKISKISNPFGDGKSSDKIIKILRD